MPVLSILPKTPLGNDSPANLTDSDLQNSGLYSGRFSDINYCVRVWGAGGYKNGDCEKFKNLKDNHLIYLNLYAQFAYPCICIRIISRLVKPEYYEYTTFCSFVIVINTL
jgi:hypothetical protein